jgi:cytochrome c553
MAKAMARDSDVTAVAAYVASMPGALPPAVVTGGDAERGRAHYQSCVACHGANGEGVQPLNGPSLNRTNDWYQLAQMQKFKQGIRGSNAADVTGSTMRPLIDPLPDEQAMKDVLAFLWTVSQ